MLSRRIENHVNDPIFRFIVVRNLPRIAASNGNAPLSATFIVVINAHRTWVSVSR